MVQERLKKILQLSIRGVDGERENAKRLLGTLLQKHGLTIADLSEEEKTHCFFAVREKSDLDLLIQIVSKVTQSGSIGYRHKGRQYIFELTAVQLVEVELLYSEYKRALAKEQAILFRAFIQKNRIFPPSDPEDVTDNDPEDWEELRRILRMASQLEEVPIDRKRLNA